MLKGGHLLKTLPIIQPPDRSNILGTIMILLVFVFSFVVYLYLPMAYELGLVAAGILFILSLITRDRFAIQVSLFQLILILVIPHWKWPFFQTVPLLVTLAVFSITKEQRKTLGWFKVGRMDRPIWLAIGATALVSGGALLFWFLLFHPNISKFLAMLPDWGPAGLLAVGVMFSVVNAAVEEGVYRGIIMQALDAAVGAGHLSVILQAVAFGFIHLYGFPSGWFGVLMATVYGLMLGYIRRYSGGMLAPFIAHIVADAVIFSIVLFLGR